MEPEQTPHPDGGAAVGNSGLPGTPASPVTTVLDAVSTQRRELQTAPTPTLSDDELRTALIATYRVVNQVEAATLHLVRALDDRPQAMPTCTAGKVAATFLVHALRLDPGQAAHDVAAARALDPDGAGVGVDTGTDPLDSAATSGLPEIGAALAAGDISRRHVDHTIGCLNRIDQDVLTHIDPDGIAGIAGIAGTTSSWPRWPARTPRTCSGACAPNWKKHSTPTRASTPRPTRSGTCTWAPTPTACSSDDSRSPPPTG
ncbi:MAG: DUF222 domain-containing protein [Kineosporiaceae bacterium]|nr:DUF222 domain-containing protein [Kineosporiaceae bacterium]